jgi:hypothetical protein
MKTLPAWEEYSSCADKPVDSDGCRLYKFGERTYHPPGTNGISISFEGIWE